MSNTNERLTKLYEQYELGKSKNFFKYSYYVLPTLYIFFWLADIVYVPNQKWTFLILRFCFIPPVVLIYLLSKKTSSSKSVQKFGLFYALVSSFIINLMIVLAGDNQSIYYAGLNLVALCCYLFFPLNKRQFLLFTIIIFAPYLAIETVHYLQGNSPKYMIINGFFIAGTIVIGLLVNIVNRFLEKNYVTATYQLEEELKQRQGIIKKKTQEGLVLERLSSQFSPQIIEAVKSGDRIIGSNRHQSQICAVFVDIVGSTERITNIDNDHFVHVVEVFVEMAINTLLKYDLTIDKFYGDGILAFSNDPVKRTDYIERACSAALEIRENILTNQASYQKKWGKRFEITIGIAEGMSSVGFFGNTSYIKQYSAIGPCLSMSQRLSSLAKPNEILVVEDISEILKKSSFTLGKKGKFQLKGFGDREFSVFNVESSQLDNEQQNISVVCKSCQQKTVYLDEKDGIYMFKCRKCGYSESEENLDEDILKSA